MSIVGDITSVITLAGKAKQIADQLKNLELKELIVDLQSKLVDLKAEMVSLREENSRLKEEAKRASAPPEVTLKENGMYYKDDGDGPFCTGCYDTSRKLIRLVDAPPNEARMLGTRRKCPVCGTKYTK